MNEVYGDNINTKDIDAVLLHFQDTPSQVTDGGTNGVVHPDVSSNDSQVTGPKSNFFSLSYYRQYFNVNTEEVIIRIKHSVIPNLKSDYYEQHIKARADLYGPFWVCLTLAFSIAIGSNLLDYFTTTFSGREHWKYGFHIITNASLVVFVYAWIIPVILWSLLKWYLSSQVNVSALELICVYGYSLVIYIPLSIFWIIHLPYLQWLLVVFGTATSGLVLISTMQPIIGKRCYTIIAAILVLHIFFSVVVFLSFYHVSTFSGPNKTLHEDMSPPSAVPHMNVSKSK